MTFRNRSASGVVLCLCLSGCIYGDKIFAVRGVVVNQDGDPIAKAEVILELDEVDNPAWGRDSVLSNDRGEFETGITTSPGESNAVLTVHATGFKPFQKQYESGFHGNEVIVLESE